MDIKKMLRRFRLRLVGENLVKSISTAVLLGALSTFLISFIFHTLIRKLPMNKALLLFLLLFLVCFIVCFIIGFPTSSKTAQRVDETGLKERISTMYSFRKSTDFVAGLQREDAKKRLAETKVSSLSSRLQKKDLLRPLGAIAAAFIMLSIPYDAFAKPVIPVYVNQEHIDFVDNLIEKLKKVVDDAHNEYLLRNSLYHTIDELRDNLLASENAIDNAASVSSAKNKIDEIMEHEISTDKIGSLMEENELTVKLAEAIKAADTKAFTESIDEIIERVVKRESYIDESDSADETEDPKIVYFADLVSIALEDAVYFSGVSADNQLYKALHNFALGLSAQLYKTGQSERSMREGLKEIRNEITEALEAQKPLIIEKDELDRILSEAKDELLGIKKPSPTPTPTPEPEEPEDPEDPENPEEPEDPENPDDPNGEDPNGDNPEEPVEVMTELIFDPYLGIVKYGEVFAGYYSDYMKALANGSVPEDLQAIMDKYFTGLSQ